ncbi:malonyl-CoA decarboxylase domain-containing protein [Desulfatiglans anilini]|uniref:malonyl-CoA decarboxylase domain-containing protein n=1 Tax=Desulfatiglans anilini TaxID=90728 RepID=UPI000A025A80|nr:malonyl-CoA decarboxylase family protein [Desulfatiglans anilini]
MVEPERQQKGMIGRNGSSSMVQQVLRAFDELEKEGRPLAAAFQTLRAGYHALGEPDRLRLFLEMLRRVEVSKASVASPIEALAQCDEGDPRWAGLLADLRRRILSPRLRRFRKLAHIPGGLKFILDFRGDLLAAQREGGVELGALDADIVFLLEMWFQEGFLYLEEITLDSSYRQIELIKNNDMVHPMTRIEEMGRRLGKDRRCFALYHRLLPFEPVIFIEVALTSGLARSMEEVLAPAGEGSRIDTAIFYSINNTQNGLAGLGLGRMLIGKVVDYLRGENEHVRTFATLSPIPGFWKRYLRPVLEGRKTDARLTCREIAGFFSKKGAAVVRARSDGEAEGDEAFCRALARILGEEQWVRDEELRRSLEGPLKRTTYVYLTEEKTGRGKPLNPVAAFHLGNGATVAPRHIHFLANPTPRGLQESCGVMVNYVYDSDWLGQIRRTFQWFDLMEVRGIFRRR